MHAIAWLPNGLSVLRIALGLAFPAVPQEWRLPIIAVAAASDFLDGYLARVLKVSSDTGRWLDPLADKVFVLALVLTLIAEGTIAPLWAAAVLTRDLVVTLAVAYALVGGVRPIRTMRPRRLGKLTTALQFVLLLALVAKPGDWFALLFLTAAVSVASAVDYLLRGAISVRSASAG